MAKQTKRAAGRKRPSWEAGVFYINALDGWRLEMECLTPPVGLAVKGAVLITHAMMADRRSLKKGGQGLAPTLARQGWVVFLGDYRGHGGSGPGPADGTAWNYDQLVQSDFPAMARAVRQRIGSLPLFFMGHSLGGHVGIAATGSGFVDEGPTGHVLLSTNVWADYLEPNPIRRLRKSLATHTLELLARPLGYFPSRLLRVGSCDEAGPYVKALARNWRRGRWISEDNEYDYMDDMSKVTQPTLSVIGKGDRLMAHHVGARKWVEFLGTDDLTFWLARRGCFDLDFDPDHMNLVTWTASKPLWIAIDGWMTRHINRS